jgi:hypothetical protein
MALDHGRDSLFRGFVDNVKSQLRHFDAIKREAAQNSD